MDEWRPITCEQFDGESADAYRRRSARIVEIITGFRMGRFRRDEAEDMERKLIELQTPALEHSV